MGALILIIEQSNGQELDSLMNKFAISINEPGSKTKTNSIYLQTNKDIYEHAEDFWFKAWILDSQSYQFSTLDKTLYITLSKASNDSIVLQEKYQIKDGMTNGHIYVHDTWPKGEYWLSAYSSHSLFDNDLPFYARRKIEIISQLGEASDIILSGNHNPSRTPIHFTIFPEGGRLVYGIKNLVAYKAIASDGRPIDIEGTVYENEKALMQIASFHDGMGKFSFIPDADKRYCIQIEQQPDSIYVLPIAQKRGALITLKAQTKESLIFNLVQNSIFPQQRIYFRIQTRGVVQFIASGILKDSLRIEIPLKDFPHGIAEATLFDSNLNPLAERLVYVHSGNKLKIEIKGIKESYTTREKVILKIKTTDCNNEPISTQLALSVSDKVYDWSEKKNILTHYYLSTQLKGNIYNPTYYFNAANQDRFLALDLLMLTQGWRKYIWDEKNIEKQAGSNRVIPNTLTGTLKPMKIKKGNEVQRTLMIFNPYEEKSQLLVSDRNGTFDLAETTFQLGSRLYLKHFPKDQDKYTVQINNLFDGINEAIRGKIKPYPRFDKVGNQNEENNLISPEWEKETIYLEGVEVSGQKKRVFRDKYLGQLDSLAKLKFNTDYVCISGILNCEIHKNDSKNRIPVEGKIYESYIGFQWDSDRSAYTIRGKKSQEYHYPIFTEEELLIKNNLTKVQGYYGEKMFYSPVYDKETTQVSLPDYRNTLLWAPIVPTNNDGEATVEFYCSDINTHFIGIIEGVGSVGQLGSTNFSFFVRR